MNRMKVSLGLLCAAAIAMFGCGSQSNESVAEILSQGLVAGCDEGSINAAAPSSAQSFLQIGFDWIDRGVPYCQCVSGGAPYRSDCSGFVSAMWGLPAPGDTTHSFATGQWDDGQSVSIGWEDLMIGDALNFPGNVA